MKREIQKAWALRAVRAVTVFEWDYREDLFIPHARAALNCIDTYELTGGIPGCFLFKLGWVFCARSQYRDAVSSLDKAVDILTQEKKLAAVLAMSYAERGYALHHLYFSLPAIRDLDKAIDIFTQESEGVWLAKSHWYRANILTENQSDRAKLKAAVADYDKAIHIFTRLVKDEPESGLVDELINCHTGRGTALLNCDQVEAGIRDLEAAHRIFTRLVTGKTAGDLALIEKSRGAILVKIGMAREALRALEHAIAILTRLVGEGHVELASQLVSVAYMHGTVLTRVGNYEKAMEVFHHAIDVFGRHLEHVKGCDLTPLVAEIYSKQGIILFYFLRQVELAIDAYDKAINLFTRLVEEEGHEELSSELSLVQTSRALAIAGIGDKRRAINSYANVCRYLVRDVERRRVEEEQRLSNCDSRLDTGQRDQQLDDATLKRFAEDVVQRLDELFGERSEATFAHPEGSANGSLPTPTVEANDVMVQVVLDDSYGFNPAWVSEEIDQLGVKVLGTGSKSPTLKEGGMETTKLTMLLSLSRSEAMFASVIHTLRAWQCERLTPADSECVRRVQVNADFGDRVLELDLPQDVGGLLSFQEIHTRSMKQQGDFEGLAKYYTRQVQWVQQLGDTSGALRILKELTQLSRDVGSTEGVWYSMLQQVAILKVTHDLEAAGAICEGCVEYCRSVNDKNGLQTALCHLGVICQDFGNLEKALSLYREQEMICRELMDLEGLAISVGNQGDVLYLQGNLVGSLELHKKEEEICRDSGDQVGLQYSLGNLGKVHTRLGDWDAAYRAFERQRELCHELGEYEGLCSALIGQSQVLLNRGKMREALQLLVAAKRHAEAYSLSAQLKNIEKLTDIHASRGS